MKLLRTGEFARRAGVTLRALRYYDQVGLLKPSGYSESGQRLYSELDYARLQQILTLKLIGLSLEEIKGLITADTAAIEHLLERQKRAFQTQARQLDAIIQTIQQAQAAIQASHTLDLEQVTAIIRAVNVSQQTDWYKQFFTDAQRGKLEQLATHQTLDAQRQEGEAWKSLFEAAQALMGRDLQDADVQALVDRWDALIGQMAQGDVALADRLNDAYSNRALTVMQDAAQFVQRARASRLDG
jgi:DNA-binding transcriptional MerR regulator